MFLVYLVIGALQMFFDDDDDDNWNGLLFLHSDLLLTIAGLHSVDLRKNCLDGAFAFITLIFGFISVTTTVSFVV